MGLFKPEGRTHLLTPLQIMVFSMVFAILVGWVLYIGQTILLPIFMAMIFVYVMVGVSDWLGKMPLLKYFPEWLRLILVLSLFISIITLLGYIVVDTIQKLIAAAPTYQENLIHIVKQIASFLGVEGTIDWKTIRAYSFDKINFQNLGSGVLGYVSSVAGIIVMMIVYAAFILTERSSFSKKRYAG